MMIFGKRFVRTDFPSVAFVCLAYLAFWSSGTTYGHDLYYSWSSIDSPNNTILDNQFIAQSFSTGSNSETLGTVSLMLSAIRTAGTKFFSVSLYSSNGSNQPDQQLKFIGSHTVNGTMQASPSTTLPSPIFSFTSINYNLNPNTRYFIVLTGTTANGDGIDWAGSNTQPVSSIQPTPTFYNYFSNNGTTWSSLTYPHQALNMVVSTPEPSTYVLSATAVGMMTYAIRRRRKHAIQA